MAVTIDDTEMTSDECAAWARWSAHAAAWRAELCIGG
jgi:hypothetical protein